MRYNLISFSFIQNFFLFRKFLLTFIQNVFSKQFNSIFLFLIFIFPLTVFSDSSIPELRARVNDLEGILDSIQVEALEDKLKDLEKRKGSQVAILIIPTTQGESIEGYSLRVVETWKLGRKNINDGVLLLIAIQDRKMRIEVGYGLEGVLPDAICKRIISEQIRPHFKEKNYYEGIDTAVNSITKLIDGEELPPPEKSSASDSDALNGGIFLNIFLLLFGTGITSIFSSSKTGRWICGAIFGFIITIVIFGMLIAANINFGLILLVCIFSFFVVTFLIYRWSSESSSSGSSWSSSSSNDSGWSSSSSDSFSGGGGDFGGGGASGDW